MKGQILIIDDNMMDIKIATSAIERTGYACFGFTDHQKAIEWMKINTPQLIFLDLQMPEITGYELIPIIKKLPASSEIPIIIASGKNQSEDVIKAIKLGAQDYIVKPLDPLVIQEKVEKTCSLSSSEFYCVNINASEGVKAFISKPIQILSFSEFGIKLLSENKISPGESIEITSAPVEVFGKDHLLLRCLSCDPANEKSSFILQMTFIGMTEPQRQFIRKSSRQIWIQAKKGVL